MAVKVLEGFPPEGRVTVDDYLVPHLSATTLKDGSVSLVLDRRFEVIVSREECDRWLPFLANAMAYSAGYSCFGKNSAPVNNYKCLFTGIEAPADPVVSAA